MMALTQCNMAKDSITGPHRSEHASGKGNTLPPGSCISGCTQAANDAKKDEQDLHKANVDACAGDPTCLANEEARHEAAVEAIQVARQDCMNSCHLQGGGAGR